MTTFADFVTQRRGEIKQQMADLRAELAKLKAAEEAFMSGEAKPTISLAADAPVGGSKKTIKELIIDVLAETPEGADARKIIDLIAKKHHVIIQRPSLSPQLSRLKEDGLLELHGMLWKGASARLSKAEGPDTASEPSNSTGAAGLPSGTPHQGPKVGSTPTASSSLRRKMLSGTAATPAMNLPPIFGGKRA